MIDNLKKNIVIYFGFRFLKPKDKILPNLSVIMSSLAVSISIAILIIVMSVMNGFTAELIEKILGLNSHISIYSRQDKFENFKQVQENINKIKDVKYSFPVISGSGMVMNDESSAGVFIKGISKDDIRINNDLSKSIISTNIENFNGFKIILGKNIARQLNVKRNDKITLIVPIVATTMFGAIPRQVQLKVNGIINSNSQQYDNYMAIVPFETAQVIFNLKNDASAIEIITKNPEKVEDIEHEITKKNRVFVSDWKIENNALIHALNVESNVMNLILSLFVIISTFTIFAVIRMMIKSKEREIAILKAHGISNKQISRMFFLVGLTICFIGMILGNIFGITFALNVDNIRIFIENLFHTKLLDGDVYLLSNLPSKLMIGDIIKTNLFAFTMSIFCVWLSIKKNTKIDIASTLRNN